MLYSWPPHAPIQIRLAVLGGVTVFAGAALLFGTAASFLAANVGLYPKMRGEQVLTMSPSRLTYHNQCGEQALTWGEVLRVQQDQHGLYFLLTYQGLLALALPGEATSLYHPISIIWASGGSTSSPNGPLPSHWRQQASWTRLSPFGGMPVRPHQHRARARGVGNPRGRIRRAYMPSVAKQGDGHVRLAPPRWRRQSRASGLRPPTPPARGPPTPSAPAVGPENERGACAGGESPLEGLGGGQAALRGTLGRDFYMALMKHEGHWQ